MRLRGPWLIRGAGLDTSVTYVSGTLTGGSRVALTMSPYTFAPDMFHKRAASIVELRMWLDVFGSLDEDAPRIGLYNPTGVSAVYYAGWRHVNP